MKRQFLSVMLVGVLSIFLNAMVSAGTVQLPKTGQTTCYGRAGNVIECTGTGQDGDIQAGVAWPEPRFHDNEDGTITDQLTGLMWLKDASCFNTQLWENALDTVADFNINPGDHNCQEYTALYSDWHLSNVNELESLLNKERDTDLWLNSHGFTGVRYNWYWTSTTDFSQFNTAIAIHMGYGAMSQHFKASSCCTSVWPVRYDGTHGKVSIPKTGQVICYDASGSVIDCSDTGQDGDIQAGVAWPEPRFTNPDGSIPVSGDVVVDQLTGLMLLRDANCLATHYSWADIDNVHGDGSISWQNALNFIYGIDNGSYPDCGGGYGDWHLPNFKELRSLIDYSKSYPALPDSLSLTNIKSLYWTSTSRDDHPYSVHNIYLNSGRVSSTDKIYDRYVLPVRQFNINPSPDITANSSDGPITVTQTDTLLISLTLDAGTFIGNNADWWILADTPFGWYRYCYICGQWFSGQHVTYQGPLSDLSPYQVLNITGLPVGSYTFYFGVDTNMNGSIDLGQIYYDSVNVTITP